jgi:ribosomal-protein-alanine N-acetyltransferase
MKRFWQFVRSFGTRTHAIGDGALVISALRPDQLDGVMAIENQAFPTPWSKSLFADELVVPETRIYLSCVRDGHVIGYVGAMLVIDEAHITTIAVAKDERGKGIGKALLYHCLTQAIAKGAVAATLEVRLRDAGAQALYHQFGFAPAGIRKNYYAEENEDGLVMWAHGLQETDSRERFVRLGAELLALDYPLPSGASDGAR